MALYQGFPYHIVLGIWNVSLQKYIPSSTDSNAHFLNVNFSNVPNIFSKILRVIKFSSHPMKFFPKPSNYRFSIERTSFTIFSLFSRYSFSKFTNTDYRDPPIDRPNVISLNSGWFQIFTIFYKIIFEICNENYK